MKPIETDAMTNCKKNHYGVIYYKPRSKEKKEESIEKNYFSTWREDNIKFWKNDAVWLRRIKPRLTITNYRKEVNRIFCNYGKLKYDPILEKIVENDPNLKEIVENDSIKSNIDMQFIGELKKNYRKTKDTPMSVLSASLKIKEKEINSQINELDSLPKKIDSQINELDSVVKEKIDSVVKEMNLWIIMRCIQIEKNTGKKNLASLTKEELEKINLWSKEPALLTKEELDSSLILKINSLIEKRNSLKKKELDLMIKKRNSWEKKLDSITKNSYSRIQKKLKIKINPQIKNIQMEEKC
jgi:hypothetical protein